MSKPKHTPGPWSVIKQGKGVGVNYTSFKIEADLGDRRHNSTDEYVAKCFTEANADLISAAPDLLSALLQARGLIIQLCNDIKNDYGLDKDVNTLLRARGIDDAINKAKGGAE